MMREMALRTGLALALLFAGAAAGRAQTVVQYHADAARSGRYVVPGLTMAKVRDMSPALVLNVGVVGPVYAAPLYVQRAGVPATVIMATEQNVLEALDAANGETIWQTTLGTPVPPSSLPCGNIDPMGITGTPVVDGNVIYAAAMLLAPNRVPQQDVFAVELANGRTITGWPIDVGQALAAQGEHFIAANQGQRGALSVAQGRVFVTYAGHYGDCRYYHGWVVGISETHPAQLSGISTRAPGGGIWAPGGMISNGHAFFVATGNTMHATRWGGGEAVLRLGLDGQFSGRRKDYFAPSNWKELDDQDLDLGATSPMLIGTRYVLALGKDGNAYLMNRANLGGIGGEVAKAHVSSVEIRTAPASFMSGGFAYVVFQGAGAACPAGQHGNLVALRIGPGSQISAAWCAEAKGLGAPIVTTDQSGTNPVVWIVDAEGDERLRAFNAINGALLFTSQPMGLVRRYETPTVGGGHIYVAGNSALYGFAF